MPNPLARTLAVFTLVMWGGWGELGCKKDQPQPAPVTLPPQAAATPPPLVVKDRVEMAVTEEGFVPSRIAARAGHPVTLVITRKTDKTCATEVVFQGKEGKTALPLGKAVEVTYLPQKSGEIRFGCGMGMMIAGIIAVGE